MKNVFIVGCGHSGTSIVARILSSHTKVYVVPKETGVFFLNESDTSESIIKDYENYASTENKEYCVEKTPSHVMCIKKIFEVRPKSKIIVCVRDPRDVACSYRERGFIFKDGIERWIMSYKEVEKYFGDKRFIFIRLEDLLKNSKSVTNKLQKFLGLDQEYLLNYYLHPENWYSNIVIKNKPINGVGNNHEKLRNWQINQPLFKTAKRFDLEMKADDYKDVEKYKGMLLPLCKKFNYII